MSVIDVEQRLIGMLMAQPWRAAEYPELDRLMEYEDHQRVFRIVRDTKTSDLLALAEFMPPDLLDYVHVLARNDSFAPENFPNYVRVLIGIGQRRSYEAYCARRLRPDGGGGTNPFKAI